jgi:hypothetical protein
MIPPVNTHPNVPHFSQALLHSYLEMAESKKCAKCKTSLGLEQFPLKANTSTHTATCSPCTIKKKVNRQAKKNLEKVQNPETDEDQDASDKSLSILPLNEFLTFLGRQKDVIKVKANVNIKDLAGYTFRREQADAIVNLMWEVMSYRFLCVTLPSFHYKIMNLFELVTGVNMITNDLQAHQHVTYTVAPKILISSMPHQRATKKVSKIMIKNQQKPLTALVGYI